MTARPVYPRGGKWAEKEGYFHALGSLVALLKSGLVDNSLLCELATHPDFPRFMANLEIYVNGIATKQVQSANAIVDAVSATIMKQHNPGLTDPKLR